MKDNSSAQPLPCPFCGDNNTMLAGERSVYVKCRSCDARGGDERTPHAAKTAWNTRAPVSQDAEQLVERGLLASLRAFVNEHARGVPFDADRQGTAIILIDEAANEIEALSRVQPSTGDMGARDCEYCGWTPNCGEVGCRVCDHGYYG